MNQSFARNIYSEKTLFLYDRLPVYIKQVYTSPILALNARILNVSGQDFYKKVYIYVNTGKKKNYFGVNLGDRNWYAKLTKLVAGFVSLPFVDIIHNNVPLSELNHDLIFQMAYGTVHFDVKPRNGPVEMINEAVTQVVDTVVDVLKTPRDVIEMVIDNLFDVHFILRDAGVETMDFITQLTDVNMALKIVAEILSAPVHDGLKLMDIMDSMVDGQSIASMLVAELSHRIAETAVQVKNMVTPGATVNVLMREFKSIFPIDLVLDFINSLVETIKSTVQSRVQSRHHYENYHNKRRHPHRTAWNAPSNMNHLMVGESHVMSQINIEASLARINGKVGYTDKADNWYPLKSKGKVSPGTDIVFKLPPLANTRGRRISNYLRSMLGNTIIGVFRNSMDGYPEMNKCVYIQHVVRLPNESVTTRGDSWKVPDVFGTPSYTVGFWYAHRQLANRLFGKHGADPRIRFGKGGSNANTVSNADDKTVFDVSVLRGDEQVLYMDPTARGQDIFVQFKDITLTDATTKVRELINRIYETAQPETKQSSTTSSINAAPSNILESFTPISAPIKNRYQPIPHSKRVGCWMNHSDTKLEINDFISWVEHAIREGDDHAKVATLLQWLQAAYTQGIPFYLTHIRDGDGKSLLSEDYLGIGWIKINNYIVLTGPAIQEATARSPGIYILYNKWSDIELSEIFHNLITNPSDLMRAVLAYDPTVTAVPISELKAFSAYSGDYMSTERFLDPHTVKFINKVIEPIIKEVAKIPDAVVSVLDNTEEMSEAALSTAGHMLTAPFTTTVQMAETVVNGVAALPMAIPVIVRPVAQELEAVVKPEVQLAADAVEMAAKEINSLSDDASKAIEEVESDLESSSSDDDDDDDEPKTEHHMAAVSLFAAGEHFVINTIKSAANLLKGAEHTVENGLDMVEKEVAPTLASIEQSSVVQSIEEALEPGSTVNASETSSTVTSKIGDALAIDGAASLESRKQPISQEQLLAIIDEYAANKRKSFKQSALMVKRVFDAYSEVPLSHIHNQYDNSKSLKTSDYPELRFVPGTANRIGVIDGEVLLIHKNDNEGLARLYPIIDLLMHNPSVLMHAFTMAVGEDKPRQLESEAYAFVKHAEEGTSYTALKTLTVYDGETDSRVNVDVTEDDTIETVDARVGKKYTHLSHRKPDKFRSHRKSYLVNHGDGQVPIKQLYDELSSSQQNGHMDLVGNKWLDRLKRSKKLRINWSVDYGQKYHKLAITAPFTMRKIEDAIKKHTAAPSGYFTLYQLRHKKGKDANLIDDRQLERVLEQKTKSLWLTAVTSRVVDSSRQMTREYSSVAGSSTNVVEQYMGELTFDRDTPQLLDAIGVKDIVLVIPIEFVKQYAGLAQFKRDIKNVGNFFTEYVYKLPNEEFPESTKIRIYSVSFVKSPGHVKTIRYTTSPSPRLKFLDFGEEDNDKPFTPLQFSFAIGFHKVYTIFE